MHRLFVALRPPRPARLLLQSMMHGLLGARWQSDDQLHLTLRFIGEVDRHQADDIAAALASVRNDPVEARFGRLGTFDRRGRIDTLWVGVEPREPLASLHQKVDQALRRAGVEADRRAFVPHVTIARFGRGGPDGGTIAAYAAAAAVPPAASFTMDYLILFESRLGGEGASYDPVERWRLG
ncbi:2'-5' RNA ligase [Sphingomonas jejuensis]|uniref:RNA 2',3'-cyclic phosphodiesterase n=1 Tax=Sphingomonas jejuensis TaxID=904715 RepID=A0ABX0XJ52_9SPHN|nr:RNA 2',3'-cyclic phosphodiesterase [Sphingomonas jejuensis]NJC32836.1 2'-5' RNA ligase [Sphingomonas jejuensis]